MQSEAIRIHHYLLSFIDTSKIDTQNGVILCVSEDDTLHQNNKIMSVFFTSAKDLQKKTNVYYFVIISTQCW